MKMRQMVFISFYNCAFGPETSSADLGSAGATAVPTGTPERGIGRGHTTIRYGHPNSARPCRDI